jgi:predicted SAM-dependent methyltransferase
MNKLYLGAGRKRLDGYVHVDIAACEGIDVVHDLDVTPWPWEDNSAEAIVAEDLVEHLELTLIQFCNEAWRVVAQGGELFVRTPHHKGDRTQPRIGGRPIRTTQIVNGGSCRSASADRKTFMHC